MWKDRKYFFGWENFKWLCRELLKMYSGTEPSYFSYKRFQTGIAFSTFIAGWGKVLHHLIESKVTDMLQYTLWAAPVLLIAGYTLQKTETAKSLKKEETKQEEQK